MEKDLTKKDLLKWLNTPQKDVPPHISKILDKYGFELMNDEFDTWDDFYEMMNKRQFKVFPNEGLGTIKHFFDNFNSKLEIIKTDVSVKRKLEKLQRILRTLEYFNPIWDNEIMELELKKHRPYISDYIYLIEEEIKDLQPQQTETKTEQEIPKTFEELFHNPEHAEPCLRILSELQPPVLDAINNYIGKAKGIFPLWVKVLKNHKPNPLIKHFKDTVYKDLLNKKVKGLNLSKDASEFRKNYVRLEKNNIELDIKVILSQYDQSGKLGK